MRASPIRHFRAMTQERGPVAGSSRIWKRVRLSRDFRKKSVENNFLYDLSQTCAPFIVSVLDQHLLPGFLLVNNQANIFVRRWEIRVIPKE